MRRTSTALVIFVAALGGSGCVQRGKPAVLYLARHGQTEWNRKSRFQGDPDLDPVGYINRVSLWLLLKDKRVDAIYASQKRRTQRTAELVARQHKLQINVRSALNEIEPGIFEGICWADVAPADKVKPSARACTVRARGPRPEPVLARIRPMLAPIFDDSPAARLPLGESYADVAARTQRFVSELSDGRAGREILVVGHGVVNKLLLHQLLGWKLTHVRRLRQANDQVFRIEYDAAGKTKRIALYTPGVGWKDCSPPTKAGQKHLDCQPQHAPHHAGPTSKPASNSK
ncbi:MAG: histidine phosphatase family protein [Myxococcales bacterium]|nr:histidine phosphatase family protein [Myxococcales bacterium]